MRQVSPKHKSSVCFNYLAFNFCIGKIALFKRIVLIDKPMVGRYNHVVSSHIGNFSNEFNQKLNLVAGTLNYFLFGAFIVSQIVNTVVIDVKERKSTRLNSSLV